MRASPLESAAGLTATAATPRLFDVTGDAAGPRTQRIVHGDVLEVTRALAARGAHRQGRPRLRRPAVRVRRDYVAESRLDGPADGRVRPDRARTRTRGRRARRDRRLPRHARAAPRGARRSPRARRARSGSTSTGARRTWSGSSSTRCSVATRSSTRSSGGARRTSAVRRRAASSGAPSTRSSSTASPKAHAHARRRGSSRSSRARSASTSEGRPFTSAPRGDYTDASIAKLDARGTRAPDRERARLHQVLPRQGRRRRPVPRASRRRALDRRAAAPSRRSLGADRLPDAEAARAPRAHHHLRDAARRPRRRCVRRQRHHGGGRACARPARGARATRSPVAIATARARLLRDGAASRSSALRRAIAAAERS